MRARLLALGLVLREAAAPARRLALASLLVQAASRACLLALGLVLCEAATRARLQALVRLLVQIASLTNPKALNLGPREAAACLVSCPSLVFWSTLPRVPVSWLSL